MTVKIEASGETLAQALATFAHTDLESVDTDALITELRQRLLVQDPVMVLKIVPFAEQIGNKKKAA